MLRRFSTVALAFLLTLVSALPVSAGTIINPPILNDLVTGTAAVGDVLYADTTTTWARLADVADGSVLRSGGVGAAPVYGKVRLSGATTDITGTLAYGSGGTGATSYTTNAILKAGASAFADSSLTDDGTTVTSTVPVLLPDGTEAAPSLIASDTDTGWYFANSGKTWLWSLDGTATFGLLNSSVLQLATTAQLTFASGAVGGASDTILARAAAANLRMGAAAANPPVAQTLSMQNASGTDIAGANFTIDASQGTGTGAGGSFIIRTAAAGGTGSSLNALATLLTVGPTNVTLASGDLVLPSAGQLRWSTDTGFERVSAGIVEVTDGSTGSGTLRATSVQFGTSNLPTISRTADDTLLQANGANTQEMRWRKDATVYASLNAGAVITPGSGTGVTVNKYGEVRTFIHSVTVTYAALSAAGLTADKTIATLPAKTRLVGIVADTTTPYTGGGVTAATLIVGKTTGGNEYLVSHDVLSAAIVVGDADADLGTSINRANAIQGGDLPSWTGTTAVSVRLTTVTANTDQLTAGSTTYYLTTESMP